MQSKPTLEPIPFLNNGNLLYRFCSQARWHARSTSTRKTREFATVTADICSDNRSSWPNGLLRRVCLLCRPTWAAFKIGIRTSLFVNDSKTTFCRHLIVGFRHCSTTWRPRGGLMRRWWWSPGSLGVRRESDRKRGTVTSRTVATTGRRYFQQFSRALGFRCSNASSSSSEQIRCMPMVRASGA